MVSEEVVVSLFLIGLVALVFGLLFAYYSTSSPHRISIFDAFWNTKYEHSAPLQKAKTDLKWKNDDRRQLSFSTNVQSANYQNCIPVLDRPTIDLHNSDLQQPQESFRSTLQSQNSQNENERSSISMRFERYRNDETVKPRYVEQYQQEENSYVPQRRGEYPQNPQQYGTSQYQDYSQATYQNYPNVNSRYEVQQEDWNSINSELDNPQDRYERSEISGFYFSKGQFQNKNDTILDQSIMNKNEKEKYNHGFYQAYTPLGNTNNTNFKGFGGFAM
ncbi:hypothetical protein EIN_171490 [Entamoeba invadens IP1]|uniref:Transmembrane protein n=1 Tax=Entamoeba invadens IP1 TaxID=370355 RepID=A0A0A1TVQ5_ENTIV|nr:hypothetical protein EIN_171490 [Entamoeba invadens IP1]ELP84574.1 hypothetical protein EIN_171490 [Entamoeba invadens IP1]|eukprot:XP_004183920.1 hypothetical protein EIN_171490 [Entamoeba invadens IP1]